MIKQRVAIVVAFGMGACATAATQSVASSTPVAHDAGSVVPLADAERRVAPNGKAWVTILARGDNAFVGKLEMEPGATVPEHRDPTEEYIHVIEGSGRMTIDGNDYAVEPGSTIYMPPDSLVQFVNGDTRLVALQVFAGPEPARKYDAWKRVD